MLVHSVEETDEGLIISLPDVRKSIGFSHLYAIDHNYLLSLFFLSSRKIVSVTTWARTGIVREE
jgi:hypothetical protein